MNNKILISSIIAIIILIGVSFTSVVGYNSVETSMKKNKVIFDSKELIFETIIEMANNPDFNEFAINNKQNLFQSSIEYKDIFTQLLKQKLIYLNRFTIYKTALSVEYLHVIYEYGCNIIKILGEEKTSELIASIEFTNNRVFEELNNIVENDEELNNNINNLKKSNVEILSITGFSDTPVICGILLIIIIAMIIINNVLAIPVEIIFFRLLKIPKDSPLGKNIIKFFTFLTMPFTIIGITALVLYLEDFSCFDPPFPTVIKSFKTI